MAHSLVRGLTGMMVDTSLVANRQHGLSEWISIKMSTPNPTEQLRALAFKTPSYGDMLVVDFGDALKIVVELDREANRLAGRIGELQSELSVARAEIGEKAGVVSDSSIIEAQAAKIQRLLAENAALIQSRHDIEASLAAELNQQARTQRDERQAWYEQRTALERENAALKADRAVLNERIHDIIVNFHRLLTQHGAPRPGSSEAAAAYPDNCAYLSYDKRLTMLVDGFRVTIAALQTDLEASYADQCRWCGDGERVERRMRPENHRWSFPFWIHCEEGATRGHQCDAYRARERAFQRRVTDGRT